MDEISHGSPVCGWVVGPEDEEDRGDAGHYSHDDGHEVCRYASRVFAQDARLIAADGVEVTEGDDSPFGIRNSEIREDGFAHPFRPAVRVGKARAAALDGFKLPVVVHKGFGLVGAVFFLEGHADVGQ